MNALAKWQKEMGFTYDSASQSLGVSRATYARYVKDGAPLSILLACAALKAGLKPINKN